MATTDSVVHVSDLPIPSGFVALDAQANYILLPLWNLATSNLPSFLRNPMLLVMRYGDQAKALYDRAKNNWIVSAVCVVVRAQSTGCNLLVVGGDGQPRA